MSVHPKKEKQMRELSSAEAMDISGGIIATAAYVAVLAFVWYEAPHIQEFMEGFYDGAQL